MSRKPVPQPDLIATLRKLHLLRLEQYQARALAASRWNEAEQQALRFGRATGEVYGLMTLIGVAATERVLLLGAEWHCAALLDAFALYLAMRRAQGETDPALPAQDYLALKIGK